MKKVLIFISICGFIISCNSNGKIEKLVIDDVKETASDARLFEERRRQIDFFNERYQEWYEKNADYDGDILIDKNFYDLSDISVILEQLSGYMGIIGQLSAYQQYEDNPDCFKTDYSHYSLDWLKDEGEKPVFQKDYYNDYLFYVLWSCCGLDAEECEEDLISIATFIHGRAWTEASDFTPSIRGTEQLTSPSAGAYWRTETTNGVFFTKVFKEDGKYVCKTVDSLEKLNE